MQRQGGLISTQKMTQEMIQISSFYVPVITSVWLIDVMNKIFFGQQMSTFHQQKRSGWKLKLWWRASKDSLKLVWFHTTWHKESERKKLSVFLWQDSSTCIANKCEDLYSESGSSKHVNRRIYIIESRIESSSERDQIQIKIWKNDKRYHVSDMPFNENIAKKRKVGGLKKDAHYSHISFVVHTLIIEKG